MVHKKAEACARAGSCPLQHLEITVRITKSHDRPTANVVIDSDVPIRAAGGT
jgi:hypothetical protein